MHCASNHHDTKRPGAFKAIMSVKRKDFLNVKSCFS
uniref:Uncharacterized protein n=1 Tax=Anguilla anguilla TaxID=7936 RepID=A0A0E9TYN1_ANGAN